MELDGELAGNDPGLGTERIGYGNPAGEYDKRLSIFWGISGRSGFLQPLAGRIRPWDEGRASWGGS